jgi:hypothetical protein
MVRRPRKPAARRPAVVSYVRELPGAVFFGPIDADDLAYAVRLQQIRSEYESDGYEDLLWLDCQGMGFDSREIRQFVANPAAITSCGYGMPIPLR